MYPATDFKKGVPTKIEDIHFPVYRKYKNNRNYFKIINAETFEEIRMVGEKKLISLTEAKLFPEKSFLNDLLFNYQEFAEEIGAKEYEDLRM